MNRQLVGLIGLFLHAFCVVGAYAGETRWVDAKGGQVVVVVQNGDEYLVGVPVGVKGGYFDGGLHRVGDKNYLSIFQVIDSSSMRPDGFCGSGNEVWLQLYETSSEVSSRILVSRCLNSISLASQNSGLEGQDSDFSSVKWDDCGFAIEWFERGDAGLVAIDKWLDLGIDDDCLPLVVAYQFAPNESRDTAEVVGGLLLGNCNPTPSLHPIACLHRPEFLRESGSEVGLSGQQALEWAPINVCSIEHVWRSGVDQCHDSLVRMALASLRRGWRQ